jgi:thioredoxin reductase (NADPH)
LERLDTRAQPHAQRHAIIARPDILIDARHHQMFPVLETSEIDRITRLGEGRTYTAGTHIFTTGEVALGAFVLLSGLVDITQRNGHGEPELIVTH